MSKKLQGNGLFESSRMMLPEHKEAYIAHQQTIRRQTRPLLDEQEAQRISHIISEAMQHKESVVLKLFNSFGEEAVAGIVTAFDPHQCRIKLRQREEDAWVNIAEIIDAEIV